MMAGEGIIVIVCEWVKGERVIDGVEGIGFDSTKS